MQSTCSHWRANPRLCRRPCRRGSHLRLCPALACARSARTHCCQVAANRGRHPGFTSCTTPPALRAVDLPGRRSRRDLFSPRRVRDNTERQRSLDFILWQYNNAVLPATRQYVLPSKNHTDLVVGSEADLATVEKTLRRHRGAAATAVSMRTRPALRSQKARRGPCSLPSRDRRS